mgnify:CR=1 FL=1
MALQKEIWLADIVEPLFAKNTFAVRSLNHSAFVSHRTVHVPNAGTPPAVEKNRTTLPATATSRADRDLTYTIAEYTSDAVHITNAEEVELSYDKRQSVISSLRTALADKVHLDLLDSWIGGANSKVVTTMDNDAVLGLMTAFDEQDIPQTGRCLILTPAAYATLFKSLSNFEGQTFLSSIDAQRGVVGRLYGFDIYQRSAVTADAASNVYGFAWHEDCVSRALGATELFTDDQNPLYYGDIFSALVRAGGAVVRADKKGVLAVKSK